MDKNVLKKIAPYLILVFIAIFGYYSDKKTEKKIKKYKTEKSIAVGTISEYVSIGGGSNSKIYIQFHYKVKGIEYKSSKSKGFGDCRNCEEKKYKVYYNKENPKEAYIDMKHELKGLELLKLENNQ